VITLSAQTITPVTSSPLEKLVFSVWEEQQRLPVVVTEAILIAEGAGDSATLARYTYRLEHIYTSLDAHIRTTDTPYDKARTIFTWLHSHILTTYRDNASLRLVLDSGIYNCAGAMALFYGAAEHYKLPVSLYTTPAHVFATLDLPGRPVRIEMTRPGDGFDFGDNIPDIVDHLVRYNYVTAEEVEERGTAAIYELFFVNSNRINPPEFLAVTYNNIGVDYWYKRQYTATMEAFEKAILLHPGSRKYRDAYQEALWLVLAQYETGDNYNDIERLTNRSALLLKNDTLFVYYLLGTARNVISHYNSKDRNFTRSRAFLDTLSHVVLRDSTVNAMLKEQQYIIDYNLTVYDYNRGDYEGAYKTAEHLLQVDSSEATMDLHAKSAAYLALALSNRQQAAQGYALLDSLTRLYHEHPVFRDAYRQVTIDYVLQSGLIGRTGATANELLAARNLLLNVYGIDSSNYYLRQLIAAVHHELGMKELRAHHYNAAVETMFIGLQYDPDNTFIRESLRLIEEYQRSGHPTPPAVNGLAGRQDSVTVKVTFTNLVNKQHKATNKLSVLFCMCTRNGADSGQTAPTFLRAVCSMEKAGNWKRMKCILSRPKPTMSSGRNLLCRNSTTAKR
jgi:tetratricopeptide (TPR) repeat protein